MKQQLESALEELSVPDSVHTRMKQGIHRNRRKHRVPQLVLAAILLIGLMQYDRIESWIHPPTGQTTASMVPGLVYQGMMYTETGTTVSEAAAQQLRGQKLGTSENTLTEENETARLNDSFASNLTDYTIYELDGYAPTVRLLAIGREEGKSMIRILDGTTYEADYFQKLRLDQGITQISYQTERTRETGQKKLLAPSAAWMDLLTGLSATVPLSDAELPVDVQNNRQIRVVDVTMTDGVTNQFQLIEGGYALYEPLHAYFDVKGTAFETVWNDMR
ncbi:hypothetical protein Exig_1544 [Exiguobacterium sibiricum 255-15]|uniref:Uncharacterized protein n=1 Tax=Exiguobacterium sibiricum (strain DSM 17290 / CCUG 55495 / CIP 109462 / JCM 13490 / 255-15) TaxID=262543 RepID=B1YGJ6_EXIS2|nr:hypothetical protein [Exiguobacterium sibiricum]ACB61000.1 hypothetical protein Exig_1544 [Exiguobacterium sibiricum 255-15]